MRDNNKKVVKSLLIEDNILNTSIKMISCLRRIRITFIEEIEIRVENTVPQFSVVDLFVTLIENISVECIIL